MTLTNHHKRLIKTFQREKKLYNKDDKYSGDYIRLREAIGNNSPFSSYLLGANSFPGPDIVFSPIPSNSLAVSLGCIGKGNGNGDSILSDINWPVPQVPSNPNTGSATFYALLETSLLSVDEVPYFFNFPTLTDNTNSDNDIKELLLIVANNVENSGQSSVDNFNAIINNTRYSIPSSLNDGLNTPFDTSIQGGGTEIYNISAVASGYTSITLSSEGLLWTLWPLAKPNNYNKSDDENSLYFDAFKVGTAKNSNFKIGQIGFFYNNMIQSCVPLGGTTSQTSLYGGPFIDNNPTLERSRLGTGLNNAGIQGVVETFLISTAQMIAILVVKVTEQVARIYNPAAGEMASERYIYVGYDGWSIINTSANPIGPMMAQTYISPQTVSGSIARENYQNIFNPNFPTTIYYKNKKRYVPVSTISGYIVTDPFETGPPPPFKSSKNVNSADDQNINSLYENDNYFNINPYSNFTEDKSNPLNYEKFLEYRDFHKPQVCTYKDNIKINTYGTPIRNNFDGGGYKTWQQYFDSIKDVPLDQLPPLIKYVIQKSN